MICKICEKEKPEHAIGLCKECFEKRDKIDAKKSGTT